MSKECILVGGKNGITEERKVLFAAGKSFGSVLTTVTLNNSLTVGIRFI